MNEAQGLLVFSLLSCAAKASFGQNINEKCMCVVIRTRGILNVKCFACTNIKSATISKYNVFYLECNTSLSRSICNYVVP